MTGHVVTSVADRLVKKKLLERHRAETDRRAVTILLTPRGVDARRQSEPLWDEAQRQFEEKMGLEAANALRSLLQTV